MTYRQLVRKFGTAEDALVALPDYVRQKNASGRIEIATRQSAEKELEDVEHLGGQLIPLGHHSYPEYIAHIPDPPCILTILGNAELLNHPSIAIVGARNASAAGRRLAGDIARDLGDAGYVVTSGLARGID